jgi:hypothetical protein
MDIYAHDCFDSIVLYRWIGSVFLFSNDSRKERRIASRASHKSAILAVGE